MNENNILTVHNEAMDASLLAYIEARKGNADKAKQHYAEAYEKEVCAISMMNDSNTNELGQAVLLKSAAHLAVLCGRGLEAERLILQVLRKDIPGSLITEMRDLLKQIDVTEDIKEDNSNIMEIHVLDKDRNRVSSLLHKLGLTINSRKIAVL